MMTFPDEPPPTKDDPMKMMLTKNIWQLALILSISLFAITANAQTKPSQQDPQPATSKKSKTGDKKKRKKKAKPFVVKVSDDNIQFKVTGTWKKAPLRNQVIEYEIKVPRVGSDKQDGRLTIMGAGGSVDANVVRWQDQFSQADGSETTARTKKKTIAGQTVHFVDIVGAFMDSPGGQAKVERKNYRMLAAIIETDNDGQYFVKLYGPKTTIDKNEKHFKAMIESLQVVD